MAILKEPQDVAIRPFAFNRRFASNEREDRFLARVLYDTESGSDILGQLEMITADHFNQTSHGIIWDALLEIQGIWQEYDTPFPIALQEHLQTSGHGDICHIVLQLYNITVLNESAEEIAQSIKSSFYELTELGNARRMVALHGKDIRYSYTLKTWIIWDGHRWREDTTGDVIRRAKDTIKTIYMEAATVTDETASKDLAKHAIRSQSAKQIRAMIELTQSEPGIPIEPHAFDAHPWLLNCANGTIDLRTGHLLPHNRDDYLMKMSPVVYDPHATCPEWDAYLISALAGDEEMIGFLRRAAGYTITGDVSEEVLFFLHGPPNAGKTTILEALKSALGTYAHSTNFETFVEHKTAPGGARDDLVALVGARFVPASEGNRKQHLDHDTVKKMTGGDTFPVRGLYQKSFEYKPIYKPWIAANDEPRVNDDDEGIWRRILKIPFTHPPAKKDPTIKAVVTDPQRGGPAVLAWAVRGCLEWQEQGLAVPSTVSGATTSYRAAMDPLRDFIDESCAFNPTAFVFSDQIFTAYQEWARASGQRFTMTKKSFGDRLSKHGCKSGTKRIGTQVRRGWQGVGLVADGWEPKESVTDVTCVTDQEPVFQNSLYEKKTGKTYEKSPVSVTSVTNEDDEDHCACGNEVTGFTAMGKGYCSQCK